MESIAGSNFRLSVCDEVVVVVGGLQPWTEGDWNEQLRAIRRLVSVSPKRAVLIYSLRELPEGAKNSDWQWPECVERIVITADAANAATLAILWAFTSTTKTRAFDPMNTTDAAEWLAEVARFEPRRLLQQIEAALWHHTAATPTARLALASR